MKQKRYKKMSNIAEAFGLAPERGYLAVMKAKLTKEIISTAEKNHLTHQDIAELSGVPRSAITGIINGSLQKVTLDRLVRILNSLGKIIEVKIKNAA